MDGASADSKAREALAKDPCALLAPPLAAKDGFTVYPHRRRLRRRKGIHFQRKLRALVAQCEAGEIPLAALTASLRSWVSHAAHGNTVGLRKAILGKIRLKPPQPGPQKSRRDDR